MPQLLCHILGDYVLQSDWMALNKNKRTFPCLVHVTLYTLPFLMLTQSFWALAFIFATHFIIDRFPHFIKRLIWLKNHANPHFAYPPFAKCADTGYYDDLNHKSAWICNDWLSNGGKEPYKIEPRKGFVTIWLYIITDNALHLLCNWIALSFIA